MFNLLSICIKDYCLNNCCAEILVAVLLLPVAYFAFKVLAYCWEFDRLYLFQQYISSGAALYDAKYKDMWVVITGATDGIGLALAKKYAERNAKLVIVSRTQSKLDDVKSQLKRLGAADVDTIQCDFSQIGHGSKLEKDDNYQRLKSKLDDKRHIGLLINNVGTSEKTQLLLDASTESLVKTFDVNVVSALIMCRLVGPQMVARKFGTIVNVSSSIIYFKTQYLQTYRATKFALEAISEQLAFEHPKLSIVSLRPGPVMTNMLNQNMMENTPKAVILNVDNYAASIFNIIQAASTARGLLVTTGHWFFEILSLSAFLAEALGLSKIAFRAMLILPKKQNGTDAELQVVAE